MTKINKLTSSLYGFMAVLMMAMFLVPGTSFALGVDEVMLAAYNAKSAAEIRVISDETLMNVTYSGASTEAAIGISSYGFTTYTPIGTADLSYDLEAAAYDTVGELCDAIQAESDYGCKLTGGIRSDSTHLLKDVTAATATDAKANGGYDVLIDTGGVVATDPYILTLGITPSTGKRVVLKYCIGNINSVDSLNVYGKLAKYAGDTTVTRNDTTKVYSAITADDTDKTIGNIYGVPWIEFAKDEHVVIRSADADSTQAAANYIECVWNEK